MASKIVIYTGAPESSTLDWNPTKLLAKFDGTIAEFAGLGNQQPTIPGSVPDHAKWRYLPLENTRSYVDFSQQFAYTYGDAGPNVAEFFTTAAFSLPSNNIQGDNSITSNLDDVDTQFYETSIAAHQQDISLSQIVGADESQITVATTSFNTTTTSFLSEGDSIPQPLEPPNGPDAGVRLSDLEDIPSARYLVSIQPQTMTINLVVGLISLSPARTVNTRWGSTQRLIEVLVGDDTRAGFAVTFWLPSSSDAELDETTKALTTFRPGDVFLLQNVALNVFTNKVYGSSLRRGLTKVLLLHRARLGPADPGGYYTSAQLRAPVNRAAVTHPQLDKARRVRDWVIRFVGQGQQQQQHQPQPQQQHQQHQREQGRLTRTRGGRGSGRPDVAAGIHLAGGRMWDVMPPVDTQ